MTMVVNEYALLLDDNDGGSALGLGWCVVDCCHQTTEMNGGFICYRYKDILAQMKDEAERLLYLYSYIVSPAMLQ